MNNKYLKIFVLLTALLIITGCENSIIEPISEKDKFINHLKDDYNFECYENNRECIIKIQDEQQTYEVHTYYLEEYEFDFKLNEYTMTQCYDYYYSNNTDKHTCVSGTYNFKEDIYVMKVSLGMQESFTYYSKENKLRYINTSNPYMGGTIDQSYRCSQYNDANVNSYCGSLIQAGLATKNKFYDYLGSYDLDKITK